MKAATEIAVIEEHCGRAAGTDAERRAAIHLRDRLEAAGRTAELQPIEVHPRVGLARVLLALVAIAGSVVAVSEPAVGSALVLGAMLDTALGAPMARRMAGRRASQNVESREDRGNPGVLILAASYDCPRAEMPSRLPAPDALLFAVMLAALACCGLRTAGLDGTALAVAQFIPTTTLIVLVPLLLDTELSQPERDPSGAAGVVTVLRLSCELRAELEQFDLWLVFTGSSRSLGLGMARWLRRRRRELAGRRAVVLSVGPVGDGALRYSRRQGPLVPRQSDTELLRICAEVAEDDRDGAYAASPVSRRGRDDAFTAISRGVPALSVWCDGEAVGDIDRAAGFCRELVERLDADAGPVRPG